MTNHTISIKNLGPLKNIKKFEVRNINLLIGESGSGKSMMAIAIALFNDKQFIDLLFDKDHEHQKRSLNYIVQDYWYHYKDYEITYAYTKDLYITLSKQKQAVDIKCSEKLKTLIQETQKKIKGADKYEDKLLILLDEIEAIGKEDDKKIKEFHELLKIAKLDRSCVDLFDIFDQTLNILPMVFIPASRSFVSDFNEMRLDILDETRRSRYARLSEGNKTLRMFSSAYRSYLKTFDRLSNDYTTLMKGQVIKDKTSGMLNFVIDKQTLPISEISSGQKELFPILLILQTIIDTKEPHLLIIEEPEAHLFPKDQKAIFDAIIDASKQTNSKILITTHSPYMLMSANNLIAAKKKNYTALEEKFIDAKEIMVHKLVDGGSESIIEDDFIDGDYIESITDDICDEYDDILNSDKKWSNE